MPCPTTNPSSLHSRGIKKIVVTSSVAVLGTTRGDEMDETHELKLNDPEAYTLAKVKQAEVVEAAISKTRPPLAISFAFQ